MASDIFVDTSRFYAILVKTDDRHDAAGRVLHAARRLNRRFRTTDYVLDETATLLKARAMLIYLASSLKDWQHRTLAVRSGPTPSDFPRRKHFF